MATEIKIKPKSKTTPKRDKFKREHDSKYAPCAAESLAQNHAHTQALQMMKEGTPVEDVIPFLRTQYGLAAKKYKGKSASRYAT